jgi:hypothetical protein
MPILLELVRATSDTVWHGMNEPGFHMPTRSFSRLFLSAIPLLLLALPAPAQENSLRQTGIVVDATAADAVQARDRALAQGRRDALNRLAAAAGAPTPTASDSQIEGMVASMIIEQERVSSTRYSGRITVVFGNAVRNVLGGAVVTGGGGPAYAGTNPMAGQPATNYVEASTSFGSLAQWMALRRQVLRAGPVATIDILTIATDGARLRLGLRLPAAEAVSALASGGVVLSPPGTMGDPWRVGLGGG